VKLLVVASRFPYPIEKGDKLRLCHQIKILSKHFDIYLFACNTSRVLESHVEHIQAYCKEIKIHHLDAKDLVKNISAALISGIPFQVGMFSNIKIRKEIGDFAELHEVDHVYTQLIRMAENTKDLPYPKTLDYMDAFGFGMHKRASIGGLFRKMMYKLEGNRVKKYEKEVFPDFDHHTVITANDRERLELDGKIEVVGNGVDADFFTNTGSIDSYDLVFVGNMGYLPNIDAAKVLVNEILVQLNAKGKIFKLLIAGARPTREVIDLAENEHVTVGGWMQDIRQAYKGGRIFVAPIFQSIGQQNKILEAMSMEIPCIVNKSVAEGLNLEDRIHCLVAESPEEFVEKILELENNVELFATIIVSAKELVRNSFSWEAKTEPLIQLIGGNTIA